MAGLITALVVFAVSVGMLTQFTLGEPGLQLVSKQPVDRVGGAVLVRGRRLQPLDGLVTTFLFPLRCRLVAGREAVRLYMASMLVLESAVLGSFLALDLLLFFLFFEALLVPMYLIIGGWGGKRRIYAAVKFFLYTMFGSAFLLVGILYLYYVREPVGKARSTSQRWNSGDAPHQRGALALPRVLRRVRGQGAAVPAPYVAARCAHRGAHQAGSVCWRAILLKSAPYGFLRFNLHLFPEASKYFATPVSILALIGIIYGAVVAMIQTDIKRLIAYSSVCHMGFVVLGIFAFTSKAMDRRGPADGEPRPVDGNAVPAVRHGL